MIGCQFTVDIVGDFICIVDRNGPVSVTNAVNDVIREVASALWVTQKLPLRDFRVIYQDSEGQIDRILTSNNRFAGFEPLGARSFDEAMKRTMLVVVDTKGNLLS